MTDIVQGLDRRNSTPAGVWKARSNSDASAGKKLLSSAKNFITHHTVFWVVCAIYIAATQIMSRTYGYPINLTLYKNIMLQSAVLSGVILISLFIYVLAWYRPARPLRMLWQKFIIDWQLPKRIVYVLSSLVVCSLFLSSFSATKTALPVMVPFYFDDLAIDIDRALFGADPWMLLHPLLGHPVVTFFINVNYNIWGIITSGSFFCAALMMTRPKLRSQYMVAFCLNWAFIGTFLAIFLSSVGPCFYEAVHGGDRFAPLMDYLEFAGTQYPIWALDTQAMLLFNYDNGILGVGSGISAMPSMHLATTTLMAIFAFKLNRKLGYVALVYLLIIYLGSIHLGWHYAIDGILSMVLTPMVWWVAGAFVRLPQRLGWQQDLDARA